ncbi:tetratricopeptide repeat protein [Verrucomicrobiaceae bacterium 227]
MATPNVKYYNAAIDAAQSGDLPAALQAVETALTEDPVDVQSWQLYSVLLNALGETEKAENAMAKVRELGLSEADELIMKAADAIGQNKIGVAITHYEDALELDPDRPEVYVSYALALMQGDYPKDADEASAKAVEMAPGDASAWYARGRILRLRGKKSEALEALEKALSLQGNLVLARYECGMILAETGQLVAALKCFEDVLKDHPEDENAIKAKAAILEVMEEGNS